MIPALQAFITFFVALALTSVAVILFLPDKLISHRGKTGSILLYVSGGIVGLVAVGMWIGLFRRMLKK